MVVRYALRYIKLRLLVVCLGGVALYLLFSYCIAAITRVDAYDVVIDPLFSPAMRIMVQQAYAHLPTGSSIIRSVEQTKTLYAQHASIAAYSIALHVPYTARITFHAHSPALVVNNEYCVTQQGTAYACSAVHEQVLAPLLRVTVHHYRHDDHELNQQLIAWINALPVSLRNENSLVWHTATMRSLQPKNPPFSYSLVCGDAPLTLSLVQASLESMRQQQGKYSGGYHWTADMRFAHQIIVKKERIRKIMEVEPCIKKDKAA